MKSAVKLPTWMVIARREFWERVRTKWFIVVTLLGPAMMAGLIIVPALLMRAGHETPKVAIVDRSGAPALGLADKLAVKFRGEGWAAEVVAPETTDEALEARIKAETLNAYLPVPAAPLEGGMYVYHGDNASSQEVYIKAYRAISDVVATERGRALQLSDTQSAYLKRPILVDRKLTNGEQGGASGGAAFGVGYAVTFLLYMAIVLYGFNVMRSVVEEKTSRVVELMVAATKPRDLMAGKVLGVGGVGLTQFAVWLGMAYLLMSHRELVLGWFGVKGGGAIELPRLEFAEMLVIVAYFLGGFFFYAALYAAIGAMVSSDQEAQQAQMPLQLLVMIPAVTVSLVANAPRGTAAQILTMIPFSSPVLMPMRYLLGGASRLQVAISLGILVTTIAGVMWAAARIYRVGILMYGKRPSLREVWRWLRHG